MKTVPVIVLTALFACVISEGTNGQQATSQAASVKGAEQAMTFQTPRPPYPYQARAIGAQGSGSIKVTFDENGKVVKAEMAKTTGYKVLDQNSLSYARANWKSSGGKSATIIRPMNYQVAGLKVLQAPDIK